MDTISVQAIPASPWGARKTSAPSIAGGHETYMQGLRVVLEALKAPVKRSTMIAWPSAEDAMTAAAAADAMAPAGLILRDREGTVRASPRAVEWLGSGDAAVLIKIIHENVRFIGELMQEIRGDGLTAEEINRVASEKYHLGWRSLDQVYRRCYWLRGAGMAELLFTGKIVLTSAGEALLARLDCVDPSDLDQPTEMPVDLLPELSAEVQRLLDSLDDGSLVARTTAGLSFVPKGGTHTLISSFAAQVDIAIPHVDRREYIDFCVREFGSKASSASSALDAVRNAGLLEQTGRDRFAASDVAIAWRSSGSALDLVAITHSSIRCVGELLPMLHEPHSVGELQGEVTRSFGGLSFSVAAMRNRLQLLREAGLVDNVTHTRYRTTALGRAFEAMLPMERAEAVMPPTADSPPDEVVDELIEAASDAGHPERFEKAVTQALREMNLDATHQGGSGDTDVLVTVRLSHAEITRVVVDAKATSHSSVLENAVDFAALEEHRRLHKADHVALVAKGFDAGRVRTRAAAAGVSLITVDELVDLVAAWRQRPLTPVELLALFSKTEKEHLWQEPQRRADVFEAVLVAVADEIAYIADAGGDISLRDIRRAIFRVVQPSPSEDEVRDVLDLLASPLIGGLRRRGRDSYHPGVTEESVAARLRWLAAVVDGAVERQKR